ncbi:MAG: 2-hydroxymuconate tautomerase [Candidatus Melainabacteria bacterium]|jgi:4-oxalocrotonate tautomerase
MPIVEIYLLEGRSEEQKRNLVKEVTEVICRTIQTEPEQVRIILSDMKKSDYSIGGVLISDK